MVSGLSFLFFCCGILGRKWKLCIPVYLLQTERRNDERLCLFLLIILCFLFMSFAQMHCSVRPPQERFFYSNLRGLIRVFKFNASTRCLKICYFKGALSQYLATLQKASQKVSSHQLNSKTNGLVMLLKTI